MKSVFSFWGFPETVHAHIVREGHIRETSWSSVDPRLGLCTLDQELLDHMPHAIAVAIQKPFPMYAIGCAPEMNAGEESAVTLTLESGEIITLLARTPEGGWRLLFDLDGTLEFIRQERYFTAKAPGYLKLGITPDQLPGMVRSSVVFAFAALRKLRRPRPGSVLFPQPGSDLAVDGWMYLLRSLVERFDPEARIEPLWPEGKDYAVTLDHDVDSSWAFEHPEGIEQFRSMEAEQGFNSAWLVVSRLYEGGKGLLDELHAEGHEIGLHGVRHDHRLAYLDEPAMRARLNETRHLSEAYGSVGFRSPSFHRTPLMYQVLDEFFSYDMSVHDTFVNVNSPTPSHEGCSTVFPHQIAGTGMLQLPTTGPEDFVLAASGLNGEAMLETQWAKLRQIRSRGGMANLLTHPEKQISSRPEWAAVYRDLLARLAEEERAWITLPRDLADWWREREVRIQARWPSLQDSE